MDRDGMINTIRRFRWAINLLAAVAAVAAVVGLLTVGLREDYRLEAFVASSDPAYEEFRAFMDEFTSNEFALLAIHGRIAFDADMERALTDAVNRLRTVPGVARAGSLVDIPAYVRSAMGERLLAHPLLAGNLISEDRRTVAVLCSMAGEDVGGSARRANVVALRGIADALRAEYPQYEFILTGPYVTLIDMYAYVDHDLMVFSMLAFVLVVVTMGAVFRRVKPMLYAGAVAACAILCTLGLTVALGIVCSLITQMLVILIIVLAVANCVHLAVASEEAIAELPNGSPDERYGMTLRHMLAPCCAVMVTTAVGFGSVSISQIAPVRRFGGLMVFGLVIALVLGFTGVYRLHRGSLPPARLARMGDALGAVARTALKHRIACGVFFVGLVVISILGVPRLRFESDFVKNFRPESSVRKSYRFIEEHLSPLGSVEVVVRRRDGGAIATAENVERVAALGKSFVAKHEPVRRALTLADLLTLGFGAEPVNDVDVQSRLGLLQLWPSGAALRRNFLNEAGDALRINLRCIEGFDVDGKLRVCAAIQREAADAFGPEYQTEVTGLYYFYAKLVSGLLRDQYRALGLTVAAITAVMGLMLRSVRWTLIAMAVNLLPVVACLGAMGWARVPVNMTTAMMLSATMGIAVDDTLHYIWRYRRERAGCAGVSETLVRTHESVGRACVFTTVVIAGGFSILMLSEFLPTAYFGGLVGFTMFVALAADLVLLPVLVSAFARRG
ncbi:MAG: MMPL family transporter [Phycisphaerales bacterium]|nr:MMPL family transporter [Phycisphaerales bacterium]